MKTVTYTISQSDVTKVAIPLAVSALKQNFKDYTNHPEWFGGRELNELKALWMENAVAVGAFEVLKKDGVAIVHKNADAYYTFADHEGDCFDPVVNDNIDPAELKRERKREMSRFNRQGAWYHTLEVLNVELDSIAGFVGNDFYGSVYEIEFYNSAFECLKESGMAEYVSELLTRVREALSSSALVLDS